MRHSSRWECSLYMHVCDLYMNRSFKPRGRAADTFFNMLACIHVRLVCSGELTPSSTSCTHAVHKLHGQRSSTVRCQKPQALPGFRVELLVLACLCMPLPQTGEWHLAGSHPA